MGGLINHSNECLLIERPYPKMYDLNEVEQDYILRCPHKEHEVVRRYMGFEEKLDPTTKQPVKIHA